MSGRGGLLPLVLRDDLLRDAEGLHARRDPRVDRELDEGVTELIQGHPVAEGAAKVQPQLGYAEMVADPNVTKVSVVGVGMRSHAGVANTMFQALADKAINIQVISTSEIKISVLIASEYTELAVRALHTAYGLDAA